MGLRQSEVEAEIRVVGELVSRLPEGYLFFLFQLAEYGVIGVGIGLVDVHLLSSALLTKALLWTADRNLRAAAARLNILYE